MLGNLIRSLTMPAVALQRLKTGLGLPRLSCGRPNRLTVQAFRHWEVTQQKSSSTAKAAPRRDFLEARQVSLYELFDGNAYQLDIPEYQRPYAWKAKQVHELLEDLQAAYQSGHEHFLGAIVTTRQGDAPGQPYWVIDGQQRLTTLVMLLGYLRAWASSQTNMHSLAERVEHMLHIPADPLTPQSTARYRLCLRSSDQLFFRDNFIKDYLPIRYHLSSQLDGPANAAGDYHDAAHSIKHQQTRRSTSRDASNGNGNNSGSELQGSKQQQQQQLQQQQQEGKLRSVPLTNETWWRMYCAGDVLACYLATAMEAGLNLQDFMHHVLKNCMVVLMIARDENTSFKIFSTLNGRGVDLAVVDKLKPELLQALPVQVRESYADRWTALESALGRPSFHALFDHFITIEQTAATAAATAAAAAQNGNGSWAHTPDRKPAKTSQPSNNSGSNSSKGFIPAGSSLVTHLVSSSSATKEVAPHSKNACPSDVLPADDRNGSSRRSSISSISNSGQPPAKQRWNVLEHLSGHSNVEGMLNMVLEYGQQLLEIRANDWSNLAAEGDAAPAIAAELEECCWFINLLSDDCWQPWALEFFYQSSDDAKRAAFIKGAELLQLYCELKQDQAFKQERWSAVGLRLLQRPFYSDQVLDALALTPDEEDEFIRLLDSRELAASADESLLAHILLRADSINRKSIDWRRLKVEKVMPTHPPEGSPWRKQKLLLPALSEAELISNSSSSSSSVFCPSTRSRSNSGGSSRSGSNRSGRSSRGRTTSSSLSSDNATAADAPVVGISGVGSASAALVPNNNSSSSANGSRNGSSVSAGMREVRYWHEITRSHWHNRLGNLVLLQPSGHESAATAHLAANLPTKLEHYRACAADEHFPEFSGGLIGGKYSRDMFSPEECRQRHGDIISRVMQVFGLNSQGF